MELKTKKINLSTGGPLVAVINEKDAKDLGLHPMDRVKLTKIKSKKEIVAVVDISNKGIDKGYVGLFNELFKELNVEEGNNIEVSYAPQPESVKYIRNKLNGIKLSEKEIYEIVMDIVSNKLSEVELTYFVAAVYKVGFDLKESASLTKAIVDSGTKLKFNSNIVFDKHCAGGVPNNRTTMIVVPIIAALGYIMPKTSSRAITSPAGTADTMEVVAPVALNENKIVEIVKSTNACMAWGGAVNLAAADDKMIKVRHPLSLDPEGMLLASILAKKKAVGATHVLIDLPYGTGAKFATKSIAKKLGKKFMALGKLLDMKLKVVYTKGSQPIGNGIGPSLEVEDVLSVLKGDGPNDLRNKAIYLATEMLKMINIKNAKQKVIEVLDSGKAYKKFQEIVVAQGGNKNIKVGKAKYSFEVKSASNGKISRIHNKPIAKLARLCGAPNDKLAGLYLRVKVGDHITKGDILFTLYAESSSKLNYAVNMLKKLKVIDVN